MALDFPSSPTNGQTYGNYYYDATVGAWNSFSSTVNTVPSTLKNLTVTTDDAGLVPFTVNGVSGQSVNLQNWKNSAGTTVASINNDGVISVSSINLANDLTVSNGGTGAGTFTSGAYLKGNGTSAIQAQTGVPLADITVINIGSGADLNTYTTQGLYQQLANVNAAGGANYPVPYAGFLEVFESTDDNFIYQRYTAYKEQHEVYIRARYASAWNAWQKTPAGTVTVAEGGTGATTLTSGAYLKGAGTSAITAQTGIPSTDLTGTIDTARLPTIPIANGGTGATTGSAMVPIIPTGGSYGSVSANGLITFTAGVRADGIFSSNYDLYEIHLKINSASAADYLYYRYCTNGAADYTNAYYNSAMFSQSTTVAIWANGNTANTYSGRVGYFLNDGATYAVFKVHGAFGTGTKTMATFQSKYSATGNTSVYGSVGFNGTTSFDGILFGGEAGSGSPNGTMQVFGYRK